MGLISQIYRLLNVHNDINAVKRGKPVQRIIRKGSIKKHAGILGDLLGK